MDFKSVAVRASMFVAVRWDGPEGIAVSARVPCCRTWVTATGARCGPSSWVRPSEDRPGAKDAAEAVISSTAATSWRARIWLPPDSGTCPGIPMPRAAASASTSTHAENCAQASQTRTASTLVKVLVSIFALSRPPEGILCGRGQPTKYANAKGTPITSTSNASRAPSPVMTSFALRRRFRTTGVCCAMPGGGPCGARNCRSESCAMRPRPLSCFCYFGMTGVAVPVPVTVVSPLRAKPTNSGLYCICSVTVIWGLI